MEGKLGLWLRWITANAAGELLGLGGVAAVAVALFGAGGPEGGAEVVVAAAVMVLLGGFEGAVVGLAQGLVLRSPLPGLRLRSWVIATVIGALAAWMLGMIPSTLGSLSADADQPPPDLGGALAVLAAAALGLVAGVILAFPQWRVLRRHLPRAGWWLPANALAWAAGMPVIFAGAGAVPEGAGEALVAGTIAVTIGLAGAVVGAVHGAALVWLVRGAD